MPEGTTATTSADLSLTPAERRARSGVHDFDFLLGAWKVAHRRLKQRWVGSNDWDVFEGVSTCRKALGGIANVEEIAMADRGFSGLTLRTFDLERGIWSIYWVSSTCGVLDPPVRGQFQDGEGLFEGNDTDDGRAVRVRFVWDTITPVSARWTQSFSDDGGRTWETNWIMNFVRTATVGEGR